jgi:hypothetical protein
MRTVIFQHLQSQLSRKIKYLSILKKELLTYQLSIKAINTIPWLNEQVIIFLQKNIWWSHSNRRYSSSTPFQKSRCRSNPYQFVVVSRTPLYPSVTKPWKTRLPENPTKPRSTVHPSLLTTLFTKTKAQFPWKKMILIQRNVLKLLLTARI